MGRRRIDIDTTQFESLCGLQCTEQEIADFFNVDRTTLWAWCKRTYKANFSTVFKQKKGVGRISLRRKQFRLASKSAAMLIWLGKQYLGQRDEPTEDTAADAGITFKFEREPAERKPTDGN